MAAADGLTYCTIIADASWCPNTNAGGFGVWINCAGERVQYSNRFRKSPKTSGQAEYYAIINALYIARKKFELEYIDKVVIQTDCMAVIHILDKDPKVITGILKMDESRIKLKHVKGHVHYKDQDRNHFCNDWCDRQAKRHMLEQRKEIEEKRGSLHDKRT